MRYRRHVEAAHRPVIKPCLRVVPRHVEDGSVRAHYRSLHDGLERRERPPRQLPDVFYQPIRRDDFCLALLGGPNEVSDSCEPPLYVAVLHRLDLRDSVFVLAHPYQAPASHEKLRGIVARRERCNGFRGDLWELAIVHHDLGEFVSFAGASAECHPHPRVAAVALELVYYLVVSGIGISPPRVLAPAEGLIPLSKCG